MPSLHVHMQWLHALHRTAQYFYVHSLLQGDTQLSMLLPCCDYTVWVCLIHEVQVKKSTHQVCGAGRGALGHWIIQSVWCRDLQFLHWIAGQMNDLGSRRFSHQMSGCPTADLRSPANTCSVLSTCMTNLIHFSPPISLLLNILRQTLFTGFHQIWFFTDLNS